LRRGLVCLALIGPEFKVRSSGVRSVTTVSHYALLFSSISPLEPVFINLGSCFSFIKKCLSLADFALLYHPSTIIASPLNLRKLPRQSFAAFLLIASAISGLVSFVGFGTLNGPCLCLYP
jgi:hypothetical protein